MDECGVDTEPNAMNMKRHEQYGVDTGNERKHKGMGGINNDQANGLIAAKRTQQTFAQHERKRPAIQ